MTPISSRLATAAVVTVAIGATAGVALNLGSSASAQPDHGRGHSKTLRFVAHDDQMAFDDLGDASPHGPGIGDMLVLTQSLTKGGKPAGRIHDVAVGVDGKRNLFQANGSIVLRGGTVEYAGLVKQTSHFVMAVTGGTGKYVGASGEVAFDFPGHKQKITVTLAP